MVESKAMSKSLREYVITGSDLRGFVKYLHMFKD